MKIPLAILSAFDHLGSHMTRIGYLKKYQLKPGDVVVDAGAFLGRFSEYAAKKVGQNGQIIAFEPNPRVIKRCINKLKNFKNFKIIDKALYDKEVQISFLLHKLTPNSRIADKNTSSNQESVTIQTTTLDKILPKLGIKQVDFLKMDIEGAEIEALLGAKEILKKTRNLAIACYHKYGSTKTATILKPLLEKMGFKVKIGFFPHLTLWAKNLHYS